MSHLFNREEMLAFLEKVITQNEDPETGDRDVYEEARALFAEVEAPKKGVLETELVAVFSTIHMPESYPPFGEVSFDEFPEGFHVYVSTPEGLAGVDVPEWLRPIVTACHAQGVRRLIFDCDGPKYSEFTQYDWEASEICDECGASIPSIDGSLANKHHLESCSLHDEKEN